MSGRQIAFGNGDEAGQPRFGGEEVVTARIERAVGYPVADRQELPIDVEQQTEFHRLEHGLVSARRAPRGALRAAACRTRERSRSRWWLAIAACSASAQACVSALASSFRSACSVRAMSATVSA